MNGNTKQRQSICHRTQESGYWLHLFFHLLCLSETADYRRRLCTDACRRDKRWNKICIECLFRHCAGIYGECFHSGKGCGIPSYWRRRWGDFHQKRMGNFKRIRCDYPSIGGWKRQPDRTDHRAGHRHDLHGSLRQPRHCIRTHTI